MTTGTGGEEEIGHKAGRAGQDSGRKIQVSRRKWIRNMYPPGESRRDSGKTQQTPKNLPRSIAPRYQLRGSINLSPELELELELVERGEAQFCLSV